MLSIFDNFFTVDECDAAVKTVIDNEPMWYNVTGLVCTF